MNLGYARVSTTGQVTNGHSIDAQLGMLLDADCRRIFQETGSGASADRPELNHMLDHLREGDVVVVCKLDRLSRSLKDLLMIVERIGKAGAGFRSLGENLDTTSPAGRAMMQMVGVFAEFEREILRERTIVGLRAARQQGRVGGRPYKLSEAQRADIIKRVHLKQSTAADCARLFNVDPATISRTLHRGA